MKYITTALLAFLIGHSFTTYYLIMNKLNTIIELIEEIVK